MDKFKKAFIAGKVNEGQNQPTWPPFLCDECGISINGSGLCWGCYFKLKKKKKEEFTLTLSEQNKWV